MKMKQVRTEEQMLCFMEEQTDKEQTTSSITRWSLNPMKLFQGKPQCLLGTKGVRNPKGKIDGDRQSAFDMESNKSTGSCFKELSKQWWKALTSLAVARAPLDLLRGASLTKEQVALNVNVCCFATGTPETVQVGRAWAVPLILFVIFLLRTRISNDNPQ